MSASTAWPAARCPTTGRTDRGRNPHDRHRRPSRRPAGRGRPRNDRRRDRAGRRRRLRDHDPADRHGLMLVDRAHWEALHRRVHRGRPHADPGLRTRTATTSWASCTTKDLLPELANGDATRRSPTRDTRCREPYFVPETKPIDVLLQKFQQTRNHMAVVLDEYGGVSGLVTMEDVLEEIVGEIIDEYDKELVEEHPPDRRRRLRSPGQGPRRRNQRTARHRAARRRRLRHHRRLCLQRTGPRAGARGIADLAGSGADSCGRGHPPPN